MTFHHHEPFRATPAYGISTMSARENLRDNLRALMAHHPTLRTILALEKATDDLGPDRKVGKSTIGRAVSDEGELLKLHNLEALAEVYGLDAWQLLSPNLNPKSPPLLRSVGRVEDELYKKIDGLVRELAELKRP